MTNSRYRVTLLALFAVGALAIGLLILVGTKPVWAASRAFIQAPNSPLAVGSTPTSVIGEDLNDDGKMDLTVTNKDSNNVSILLGNGDGTFQNASVPPC